MEPNEMVSVNARVAPGQSGPRARLRLSAISMVLACAHRKTVANHRGIGFFGAQDRRRECRMVRRIGESLRLESKTRPIGESAAATGDEPFSWFPV